MAVYAAQPRPGEDPYIYHLVDGVRTRVFGETPIIFMDSHPEEQDSYLGSYFSSLKSTLATAWTGVVPPFLEPGEIRIVWWTTDGSQGNKDYALRKWREVREYYDILLNHEDVRRCLISGYPGQNPFAMTQQSKLLIEMLEQSDKEIGRTERQKLAEKEMIEGKVGQRINAEEIVEGAQDVDEKQRLKEAKAREKLEV